MLQSTSRGEVDIRYWCLTPVVFLVLICLQVEFRAVQKETQDVVSHVLRNNWIHRVSQVEDIQLRNGFMVPAARFARKF